MGMTRTFAIPDLHGRYDLLALALRRIEEADDGGKVVFLGDYVDRGPESRKVIERLMAGPADPSWQWICLQGNHEAMMLVCLEGRADIRWWLANGGGATLISYGQKEGETADPSVVPLEHKRWLANLPLLHVDRHRVFVHAGVAADRPLDRQDPHVLQWVVYDDGDEHGHGDRHVVHGHHPVPDGPLRLAGRTDLDTFAWATGRIVIGVFDDETPGGPVSLIEVRADDAQA